MSEWAQLDELEKIIRKAFLEPGPKFRDLAAWADLYGDIAHLVSKYGEVLVHKDVPPPPLHKHYFFRSSTRTGELVERCECGAIRDLPGCLCDDCIRDRALWVDQQRFDSFNGGKSA